MVEVKLSNGEVLKIKDDYAVWIFRGEADKLSNEEKIADMTRLRFFKARSEKEIEEKAKEMGADEMVRYAANMAYAEAYIDSDCWIPEKPPWDVEG